VKFLAVTKVEISIENCSLKKIIVEPCSFHFQFGYCLGMLDATSYSRSSI